MIEYLASTAIANGINGDSPAKKPLMEQDGMCVYQHTDLILLETLKQNSVCKRKTNEACQLNGFNRSDSQSSENTAEFYSTFHLNTSFS